MSAHEAVADFLRAMELEGVKSAEPIAQRLTSGELIRFRCDGDGKGRQNGWAILYLDERPAGAFGNYRLGVDRKWKLGEEHRALSQEEREQLQREWAEAKQRRHEEKERCEQEAAAEAAEMWDRAGLAVDHPYIVKKALDAAHLRVLNGWLLIPMYDGTGRLWNLQRIAGDGTKRFLRGGRTDGLFTIIGEFSQRGEKICIGEGYATMAAVNRSAEYPCIVAFSAKNIGPVARLWNDARPDLEFIICADDDSHLEKNIGLEAARAAAEAIGARVAVPLGRAA